MEIKNLLKDWKKKEENYELQEKKIEDKIIQRKKQIERLKKKQDKNIYPHWVDEVLKPLGYEIEKKLKGYKFDDNLHVLGMGCNCMMSFEKENEKSLLIGFRPAEEGLEIIDYSSNNNRYGSNSIGYMN